jgi:beta-phosphoglucomutase
MIQSFQAAIFDLDGVIVDTAKYHYLAWKRLANENGFDFTKEDNERLKGVSRMRSLEILLEIGGKSPTEAEKEAMAARKNAWYVEYLLKMDTSELLPGAVDYLRFLRKQGVKTALGSASKNAHLILDRLNITPLFDAIIDGNEVQRAKPDPEVFLRAAEELDISPENCVVFEDAEAGIEAARRGGMGCVGVGSPSILKNADVVISGLDQLVALTVFPITSR